MRVCRSACDALCMSEQTQFRSVLKATSIIGGSSLATILIGMFRTKALALLLGPAGVGLAGLFYTLMGPITTLAGLGVAHSGVRRIAEAQGRGNSETIAQVATVLRRLLLFAGILGGVATVALSPWLSRLTFQSDRFAVAVAALGATVVLGNIVAARACVLQGTRKISELAKMNVWSALGSAMLSVPCFLLWGMDGVAVSLVAGSAVAVWVSWLYFKGMRTEPVAVPVALMREEAGRLLRLGVPLMGTALMGACVAYWVRLIVRNQFGLEGVGVWVAAFNISGILIGFVLNAMAVDYYPRLAAISRDNVRVSKEVNTQVEVALYLALPALLVTLLFAPLGITLFYSGAFDAAIPVLRWSVYGMFLRVVTWPLGFIILAQGKGALYFANDLFANGIYLLATYYCSRIWGLPGLGIAGLVQYVGYLFFILPVAYAIARTTWSKRNTGLIVLSVVVLACGGCLPYAINNVILTHAVSLVAVAVVSFWSVRCLSQRTGLTWATAWRAATQR